MGSSGGGKSQSSTTNEFAPEVRPLMSQTGTRLIDLQKSAPVEPFATEPNPLKIAPLSSLEQYGISRVPGVGAQPAAERLALLNAQLAPGVAGQTPTGFDSVGAALESIDPLTSMAERTPDETNLFSEAYGAGPRLRALAERSPDFGGIVSEARDSGARLQALAERVPGANIEESPAFKAAMAAYEKGVEPGVVNQMTLSGLGHGTALGETLGKSKANYLFPTIQEELAREERALQRGYGAAETGQQRLMEALYGAAGGEERAIGRGTDVERDAAGRLLSVLEGSAGRGERAIERGTGVAERGVGRVLEAGEAELGRGERAIGRESQAMLSAAPLELSAGGAETQRRLQELDAAMRVGGVERGVAQSEEQAAMADYLRRQALSEQALFGPMGQVLPTSLGSTTTGKESGGGITVICTELYNQGLMDDETYAADQKFGQSMNQDVMAGYHLFGIPIAGRMRKSKALTRILAPVILMWAKEMRRRVDGSGKGSAVGKILMAIGIPLCRWLGKKVMMLKGLQQDCAL